MRLAILGAGGDVARAILPHILRAPDVAVGLYTRSPERLQQEVESVRLPQDRISIFRAESFGTWDSDAIVNFVGAGDPRLVRNMAAEILELTETWDTRVLAFLEKHPGTRYIFASSGVATGESFDQPRQPDAPIRALAHEEYYARAKAEAEFRHRKRHGAPIVDIRIFSFFSSNMDPALGYFMSDVQRALLSGKPLTTNQHDFARDYVHSGDLAAAIMAILNASQRNQAFDVLSVAPIRKFDLLRELQTRFALQWKIAKSEQPPNKLNYYSCDKSLSALGYAPARTSKDTIVVELDEFLEKAKGGRS